MRYIFGLLILFTSISSITKAQERRFYNIVKAAVDHVKCDVPEQLNPVSLNAVLIQDNNSDSVAVVIKTVIYSGWHIYAFVPDDSPYIVVQLVLRTEDGEDIVGMGAWEKSAPRPSFTDPGVLVYEDQASFICFFSKEKLPKKMKAGLYYQSCDIHQCLPPKEKVIDLSL